MKRVRATKEINNLINREKVLQAKYHKVRLKLKKIRVDIQQAKTKEIESINHTVVRMRQKGDSFSKIGKHINRSPSRVRDIYIKQELCG